MNSNDGTTTDGVTAPTVRFIEDSTGKFLCPSCGQIFPKTMTSKKGKTISGKIACIGHYNTAHQKIHPTGGPRTKAVKTSSGIEVVKSRSEGRLDAGSFGQGQSQSPVSILPVNFQDYLPHKVGTYVASGEEFKLFAAHLESGIPLLEEGPKGVGKTLGVASFADAEQIPMLQFDCSENVRRTDLIGRFVLKGEEVSYMLGILATAIEVANQHGKAILVFEEINALSPNMQKVLNQLLDWRRHVYVPEVYRTYNLKPEARLLIMATMNPSTYGGVFQMNEDLKSRFAELQVTYPDEAHEVEVINVANADLPKEIQRQILLLAKETRNSKTLSYALSPRDVAMFARLYGSYQTVFKSEAKALKYALKTSVQDRYEEDSERKTIAERIRSIFGVSA